MQNDFSKVLVDLDISSNKLKITCKYDKTGTVIGIGPKEGTAVGC